MTGPEHPTDGVPSVSRWGSRWGRLAVPNHRGLLVPRTLGFVLLAGALLATVIAAAAGHAPAFWWGSLAGLGLVSAAGLVDDVVADGPRGLRGHLRELANGRMTTGLLKALAILGAAVVVIALDPARDVVERCSAVVLLAASANLWNDLDVRPGRALKAFAIPGLAFVLFGPLGEVPAVVGVLLAGAIVLPLDLRERAMLGDAGANLLGFAAGTALVALLSGGWLVLAAALAVALNLVAETISLSRVISAVPPLRWLDAIGRRP